MKHILIPTDFSENAKKAYPFALNIASKTNSAVTFLLAIEQPFDFAVRVEEKMSALTDYAHTHFQDLINELKDKKSYSSLDIDYKIVPGKTGSVITNTARELDTDLIVMGSKGSSAIKKILFGSVSTSVVSKSPAPVMLIPENSAYKDFHQITFTTAFREKDIELLRWVTEFAANWKSKIDVLHIASEKDFKNEIQFRGFREISLREINYPDLDFTIAYAEDFFKGAVEQYSKNKSLFVMGRYEMNFLDALFDLNEIEELTLYSKIPLLVLPANKPVKR